MDDHEKVVAGVLGAIAAFVVGTVFTLLGSLVGGFVLSKLWLWHVVAPLGVAPLPYVNAAGIALAVTMLVPASDCDSPPRTKGQTILRLVGLLMAPWVALFVGWILA